MNLSTHFTLEELLVSETAARQHIDNTASPEIVAHLGVLAQGLEQIRMLLGNAPIIVTSGYRCVALNTSIGGAPNSQHMQGYAADLICPRFGSAAQVCTKLRDSDLAFDQLIYEYDWCHVSFAPVMRHSVLTLNRETRGYLDGIVV